MDKIKIDRDYAELRRLDELGEAALKSPKLMALVVNGATLMSVNKDTLRGIIRVLLTGAAAEVTRLENEIPHWAPVSERLPEEEQYRDSETGELIPLFVCVEGAEYPFRAFYDGKSWGDGLSKIDVKYWMPLPQPPKEEK